MNDYIVVQIAGVRFGMPVTRVGTVFRVERLTRIPGAPPHLVGLFNLRGKIMPILSLERHLDPGARLPLPGGHAIGIEQEAESYGLLIDTVGDVIGIGEEARIETPRHGHPALVRLTAAVYQTPAGFLPILDLSSLLAPAAATAA